MKIIDFEKITQLLGKEHKVTVEEGNRWAADLIRRVIFYKKDDIMNLSEDHILGFILHEIAHIHYTSLVNVGEIHRELKENTLNLIEDIAIEHLISQDYPNAGDILDGTRTEVLDTLIKILPTIQANKFEKALLYSSARFHGRGFLLGTQQYEVVGNELSKIIINNKDNILNRKTTNDLMPIVEQLVETLIKHFGEPLEEEKQEMQEENGPATQKPGGRISGDKTKQKIINKMKEQNGWDSGIQIRVGTEIINSIVDQTTMIGKKIRTVLKRNNSMEYGGRYKSGKLMAKRLVRTFLTKDRNPFARRIVKSNQSYAFAVACDTSGSMFNDGEANYALSSLLMTGEALRMANIQRSITIFGGRPRTIIPMSKKSFRWEDISNDKEIERADTGSTYINKAIAECADQLRKVRAEKKIMIILTDGSSDFQRTKDEYIKAKNEGILCLGITLTNNYRNNSLLDEVFGKENNININLNEDKENKQIGEAFIRILKETITIG